MDVHNPVALYAIRIYNTCETIFREKEAIPDKALLKSKAVRHCFGTMSIYVDLKGIKEEFGLKASNV